MLGDNKNDDEFIYDLDEATKVVWENIPFALSDKFAYGEIYHILEIEFHYLESIGIMLDEDAEPRIHDIPIEVDWGKLQKHVIDTALATGLDLSLDEFEDIMDAELIYYDINGALGDAGEYYN